MDTSYTDTDYDNESVLHYSITWTIVVGAA